MANTSQAPRTPGGSRRRGPPKAHQPFQHDELARGRRTGKTIKAVIRNEEDMEDFDALMMSGGTSLGGGRDSTRGRPGGLLNRDHHRANQEDSAEVSMEIDSSLMEATPTRALFDTRPLDHRSSPGDEASDLAPSLPSPVTRDRGRRALQEHTGTARRYPQGDAPGFDADEDGMDLNAGLAAEWSRIHVDAEDGDDEGEGAGQFGEEALEDDGEDEAEVHSPGEDTSPLAAGLRGGPPEDETVPRKRRGRPTKAETLARLAAERRARQGHAPERGVSEVIDVHAEGEGHYFDEEGRRRNARVRYAPLEYWRNEKVVYGRRQSGVAVVPVIKQIIKVAPDPVRPVGSSKRAHNWRKRKSEELELARESEDSSGEPGGSRPHQRRAVSETAAAQDDHTPPEKGWDIKTDPLGVVIEYVTKSEVERRIAFTESMVQPREAANAKFKFQKIFGDGEFLAAGMLSIPVGETKPAKSSKDNSYVFYVIQGAVKVQIYRTSFLIAVGGMFLVPRGNVYSIENVAERETILFFAQARKIPEDGSVNLQDSEGTPMKRHASMTPGPSDRGRSLTSGGLSDRGDSGIAELPRSRSRSSLPHAGRLAAGL